MFIGAAMYDPEFKNIVKTIFPELDFESKSKLVLKKLKALSYSKEMQSKFHQIVLMKKNEYKSNCFSRERSALLISRDLIVVLLKHSVVVHILDIQV